MIHGADRVILNKNFYGRMMTHRSCNQYCNVEDTNFEALVVDKI